MYKTASTRIEAHLLGKKLRLENSHSTLALAHTCTLGEVHWQRNAHSAHWILDSGLWTGLDWIVDKVLFFHRLRRPFETSLHIFEVSNGNNF